LAEGQKVWIATDSKKWAESIIASGMLAHDENMILIDADTKKINPNVQAFLENPNEESQKYDLIFASPTISSGVSINHNHFDFVAGYFSGKSVAPTDAYQMLGRVRQCLDYMICLPAKAYSYHGEIGVINGIDAIYQQGNRQLSVNDFANLYQSILTEHENALAAFSESLLWILESKKIKIERFTGLANHAESEYALKTIRSLLNDERKQQLIDAPCITEEQAKQIDRKELKTAEDLNALEALKIKNSLGYAHTHKLTESDLALNPADLKRFNAFRGLTTVYDESGENPLSQKFNDQRAKAYKEILGNLKPDSTFGRDEITAIMSYVVQHRFRFALLGIVSAKLGRIYRDKQGNVKPYTFSSLKDMTQEFLEIIKRLGLRTKDARTKASKNTDARRLQLGDNLKSVSQVAFNTISNSGSETKTARENLYQLDASAWETITTHADRLAIKKGYKPLPIVLEIRKEIAEQAANDDFDWIEPIPIQNIP
jgi:putative DNA primase/helicase